MTDTIKKEKRKKWDQKTILVCAGITYVYLALAYFHFMAILGSETRPTTAEALNRALTEVFTNPAGMFPISTGDVLKLLLGTFVIGLFVAMGILSKILREHDKMNAKELKEYSLKFASPLGQPEIDGHNNMIISHDIQLAIDNRGTRRNCNFVITDPSGEMLNDYGKALEDNGYAVKAFNISDVYRENHYNPFHYIRSEKDVFILVNTLVKNTTSEGKGGGDPFWENSEKLLLEALILYIWYVFPREDQNFSQVMYLLSLAEVDENDPSQQSQLDQLFDELESVDPDNLAVDHYKKFKIGAGKTLKSILFSINVRLDDFSSLSPIVYGEEGISGG